MGTEVTTAPRATYRLQLHAGFDFDAVAAIADYLAALGVSHVYASPYLQAVAGSKHGYDVIDPTRVSADLGGGAAHDRMCGKLGECGLGQILDIVPNHMALGDGGNLWWKDVLENGESSRYAGHFDVEWRPPEAKHHNTVLLPVLADHYGRVLEAGEIRLERNAGAFQFRYRELLVPAAPRSLNSLLSTAAERCGSPDLAFIADSLGQLPLSTATDVASVTRRHRDKEVLREQLARLCRESPPIAAAIDQTVAEINVEPDALDALLERQNYRLAFWKAAGRDLGYRRFFDINTLISLRMEDDRVFEDTHALILHWLQHGVLDGVRIDHPDGLRDPEEYFKRLRKASPGAWIVAEKILQADERLPSSWPIAGTTGYEFIFRSGGLFIDPAGEQPFGELYREFTGDEFGFEELVHERKLQVLRDLFGSDLNRLTAMASEICERHRRYRDYSRHDMHEVLREAIACFPVYRTYIRPAAEQTSEEDARLVTQAIDQAKARRPDLDQDLFHFLRDLLLLRIRGELEGELTERFQQLTGPVTAKGVEDTSFYAWTRFIASNEVGGDPARFCVSPQEFHSACQETQRLWPQTMLASSTHDTKRSEDVRARLAVLSEIPAAWREAVNRWAALNALLWKDRPPDRNVEYFLYQTLVGAWPVSVERLTAYAEKACREAKTHTTWTSPDAAYERSVREFVVGLLHDGRFTSDLKSFVRPLVSLGRINSLSQTLLKLTAPGIPDFYQGMELWTLTLVDPDNRRPVDYDLRRRLLAELDATPPADIWDRRDEGLPKLWLIRQGLRLRRERPASFGTAGAYRPIAVQGAKAEHAVAYYRGQDVAAVAPRLVHSLAGDWQDARLPLEEGTWRNVLTGESWSGETRLADLLRAFPVALLSRDE